MTTIISRQLILDELLLVEAAVTADNSLVVCAWMQRSYEDDETISKVLSCKNDLWVDGPFIPWEATSICISPEGHPVVLGREGHVVTIKNNTLVKLPEVGGPEAIGPFRKIKTLNNQLYVLGEDHGVYHFNTQKWQKLPNGFPSADLDSFSSHDDFLDEIVSSVDILFDIASLPTGKLCATGTSGEIWVHDSHKWRREHPPTNMNLFSAVADETGNAFYIGGQNGTLLHGSDDYWDLITMPGIAEDFISLAVAPEALYIATGQSAIKYTEDGFKRISYEEQIMPAHFALANSNVRVMLARKEVFISNDLGNNWRSLLS